MHYVHEFSEHSMILGFFSYTIALLLIPQGVANNWKNFEQPLSNKQGGGETRSWKKTRDEPFLRTCCPLVLHALKPHGILWMCPSPFGRPWRRYAAVGTS